MAKRIVTKIGDIFEVEINEKVKKYFQYIANDSTQLNSSVVRVFSDEYGLDESIDLEKIVQGEVHFYAHCILKVGIKYKIWQKVGNSEKVGDLNKILFRDSNDSGIRENEEVVKKSEKWYVWRINDKEFTRVGKLVGENRKADLGVVVNPFDIRDKMKLGEYQFLYPGFE